MTTTGLRTRRRLAVVLAGALALGGLVALAPSATAAQTGSPVAQTGVATWGLSDYLNSSNAGRPNPKSAYYTAPSTFTPAVVGPPAVPALSTWGNGTGTVNPTTGAATLEFKGTTVNWALTGNQWLTLTDLQATFDGTGAGSVSAVVEYGATAAGATEADRWAARTVSSPAQRVTIVDLSPTAESGDAAYPAALGALQYTFAPTATTYSWSGLKGRWSDAFMTHLAGNYVGAMPPPQSCISTTTCWGYASTVVNNVVSGVSRYPSEFKFSFNRAVAATTAAASIDGDGVTITVDGTGFLKTSPGVYVSLRERTPGDAAYAGGSVTPDLGTAWVSNNAADIGPDPATGANAAIGEDGAFTVDLKLNATTAAKLDPAKTYTIVTRKAHGQGTVPANASQITEVPVDIAALKQTTTVAAPNVGIPAGATATVNATVTPATSGTPSGSVLVKDGDVTVGTGTLSGGVAAISVPGLSTGSKSYALQYSGDNGYWKSVGSVTISVAAAGTSVTPSLVGDGIKLAVSGVGFLDTAPGVYVSLRQRVSGDAAYAGQSLPMDTPTAWVSNNAADIGPDPVTGAAAAINDDGSFSVDVTLDAAAVAQLDPTKAYTIVTRKAHGQGTVPAHASQITEIPVNLAALKQTTTVAAPNVTIAAGTTATVNATVTPATSGTPTGTVVLKDGDTTVGTGTLSGGTVAISVPGLPAGSKSYALQYSGADGYWKSAGAVTITVGKNASAITVTGPASVAYRTAATYTVNVSNGATGTVVVTGAGVTYNRAISAGKATFVLPATLTAGVRTLKFAYAGDANTNAATTVGKTITIAKGATSITAAVTSKWTSTKAGRLTVTIKSLKGGPVPVGKVTLTLKKGTVTKTVAAKVLSDGKVVLTLPKSAKGKWSVKATYLGSTQHAGVTKTWFVTVR